MLSGDCNVCINGKMPSYSATCVECGLSRKNYKPKTNADKLRSMSDEELAEFLKGCGVSCPDGHFAGDYECHDCKDCWLDWLRQEVQDG